ncbi:MAG: zinc ribbon domain-containing protein [Thermoplasmata archaeon]
MAGSETGEPMSAYAQAEAQSARTFALVGFVFYIIGAAVAGISVLTTLVAVAAFTMPGMVGFPGAFFFSFLFSAVFLGAAVFLTLWAWGTLQDIEAGNYLKAQAPSLVLGVLGLFFALIVGGIFLILAYVKIGNVVGPVSATPHVATPRAVGGRICPHCGRPIAMDAQFCSYCGERLP